jgi:hypothetical protein
VAKQGWNGSEQKARASVARASQGYPYVLILTRNEWMSRPDGAPGKVALMGAALSGRQLDGLARPPSASRPLRQTQFVQSAALPPRCSGARSEQSAGTTLSGSPVSGSRPQLIRGHFLERRLTVKFDCDLRWHFVDGSLNLVGSTR